MRYSYCRVVYHGKAVVCGRLQWALIYTVKAFRNSYIDFKHRQARPSRLRGSSAPSSEARGQGRPPRPVRVPHQSHLSTTVTREAPLA